MKTEIAKLPLGGPAWLRALAAEKEELYNLIRSPDEENRRADLREIHGLRDAAARMASLENAMQSIADEAIKHHEHNPVSGIARLPKGYSKILNMADHVLSS